ncbi:hypothetical protein HU200_035371 [Digitaria exilis]|uniref:Flavin-containing monooxygenase n=1 Tax=Digitaria exilis TaxID=1010633 RepID=A0A835BFZ9_9POAL|nr:hypothetical protein HU200_035371 [Digitaria exilis]
MPSASLRLAVVGAGAAGLAAARELRREGHAPVVFERAAAVGGTWLYTPPAATSSDPLGAAATHSSLYASLRTNLPRETMGFLDFPFSAAVPGSADPRRFPGHEEVLRYLQAFARRFDLLRLIRFETEVLRVRRVDRGGWAVTSRKLGDKGSGEEEVYDAVVVCNGHYTEPRIAVIPGVDAWPGKQMHSHNYRVPEPFLDQVVIIIGASASAVDISRDIASTAKEVHIADRSALAHTCVKQHGYNNLWLHSMVIPFPMFQLQSKWVAGVLSGRIVLPSKEQMMEDVETFYSKLEARGWPKRYTHNFANYQFEYDDWLAEQCGHPAIEEWRKQMYHINGINKAIRPERYRDEWDDDHLVAEANEDFKKYL